MNIPCGRLLLAPMVSGPIALLTASLLLNRWNLQFPACRICLLSPFSTCLYVMGANGVAPSDPSGPFLGPPYKHAHTHTHSYSYTHVHRYSSTATVPMPVPPCRHGIGCSFFFLGGGSLRSIRNNLAHPQRKLARSGDERDGLVNS